MGAFKGVYVLIRVSSLGFWPRKRERTIPKPQTEGGLYSLVQLGCNPGQQVAEVQQPCSHHFGPNPASFQAP